MSREIDDIKKQLGDFSNKYGPAVIVPATVLAVNDDDTLQIELSEGAVIDDARLKSVVKDGNKIILVPKVGSVVQVARIENSDEFLVIAVDEITEVVHVIDGVKFSMDADGFLLKKGDETLKGLVADLFTAINNMVFTTNSGPTINLVNAAEFTGIKARFDNFLKDN